ncbi:TPA: ImmA/IrrE family metallo-endopeptidase [Streptococcus agalactiae]|nr:ImmA/IrrE family metallo-endopeptidase [Streptococcus agalactiae]HEN7902903.1 ImmA/IrrE family metallo-endopeptidase [Streptococcus agalactiae]
MTRMYSKVSQIALEGLYYYLKLTGASKLAYTYEDYFDYVVKQRDIKVMSHHFTGRNIEGLTVIDDLGTSLSYERDNPVVRQNFTKCHELGHVLLEHKGKLFTELADNQDSLLEKEANLFSSIILMPDIILLSKIFYQRLSFESAYHSFKVSSQAFEIRLSELLKHRTKLLTRDINQVLNLYKAGNNSSILSTFRIMEDDIVSEFECIEVSIEDCIQFKLKDSHFVTSRDFEELEDLTFLKDLKEHNDKVDTWLYYEKGKTIGYVWLKAFVTKEQAQIRARNILLLEER